MPEWHLPTDITTSLPSSLEIAQGATLRPIAEVAADAGLLPDEVDLYGRYKAKVSLSVLERLAERPDPRLVCVTTITPTKFGMQRMPGYGRTPAAHNVDIDDEGRTVGLF